jgi:hypothetical protein
MLLLGMLFGLLVLGPLSMLIVFAVIRSDRAMRFLRGVARPRPSMPPAPDGEPEA